MPPVVAETVPKSPVRRPLLTRSRLIVLALLVGTLLTALTFEWTSRDAMAFLPLLKRQRQEKIQNTLVDLRPWQTAEDLAALAVTSEEQTFAREAEHLADHEVDQAFASALRQAQISAQHRALQGEALTISQKAARLQQLVNEDQSHVSALTKAAGDSAVQTTRPDTATGDLELAKAQLGLDSDELADAQQDLARALGDERGRLQQELAAHEAAMKRYDAEAATKSLGAVAASNNYGTLIRRLGAWFDQRTRYQLLQDAASQADSDSRSLMAQHDSMQNQKMTNLNSVTDRTGRLNAMRSHSVHSQMLSIYDDRIQAQTQLGGVYRKWAAQVLIQHRIVFHLLMRSISLLVLIVLAAALLDLLIRYLFDRPTQDRRIYSVRLISKLIIQLIAVVLILIVLFGTPREMPTIVGLTTAGLTVVLQDFIIAFCGWFVLMGKNGIRTGDWVEINGVSGEVLDIGIFRTSMLETGNWTDHGHPTGRRVTLTNSFAIKGQYFNFTTSGQWLWDEITVTVTHSDDVYATLDLIRQSVLEETGDESRLAESEWKRVGRATGLNQISAAVAANMRPSATGIDIVVRYVTRAASRYEVRNRLYQRIIGLLHKPVTAI